MVERRCEALFSNFQRVFNISEVNYTERGNFGIAFPVVRQVVIGYGGKVGGFLMWFFCEKQKKKVLYSEIVLLYINRMSWFNIDLKALEKCIVYYIFTA